jgi:hypothetical protein
MMSVCLFSDISACQKGCEVSVARDTHVFFIYFSRYATASTTLASAVSYLISKNTYRFLKPKK